MPYLPLSAAADASWVDALAYGAPAGTLVACWSEGLEQWVSPGGNAHSSAGVPAVALAQLFVDPLGIAPPALGVAFALHDHPQAYRPPQFTAHATWFEANAYSAPDAAFLRASWDNTNAVISPGGFDHSVVSQPHLYGTQYLHPSGWDALNAAGKHYALHPFEYPFPQWTLNASWVGKASYAPPPATAVNAAWRLPSAAKQLALTGWSSLQFGGHTAELRLARVFPPGIAPPPIDKPHLRNTAAPLAPSGFATQSFGRPTVFNWRTYAPVQSWLSQQFGAAYVKGGVKYVPPKGIDSLLVGKATVINTRADQTAKPTGIAALPMPKPAVSPQILRAAGVLGTVMGAPVVQFPPHPAGWLSQAFGYPVVEFKTKLLTVNGFVAFETGYPRVRDRAQKVWPSSVVGIGVFGDVQARLSTFKIQVAGFDAHGPSPWAVLRNVVRVLEVPGLDALAAGLAEIRNKSPNLTPDGFDSQQFGTADVAGWLKRIAPKGVPGPFNAFPAPVVWQTPSFAPKGIAAPAVPLPTVWLRHRAFDIGGFETLRVGSPVVDFRWRKVVLQGKGIAGAAYGQPRVEHSYRALAPLGWTRLAFGNSWLSFRRRTLVPRGIEPIEMSSHQIGGTRYISAAGFEATRWLTRIIPEAREIFPKTFGAAYGWPTVEHYRRYVQPVGFATDTDYRDRWGLAKAWNLRQYIIQEENAESLLWPPKFSPWLKLANRNKTIGAIGYAATQYGRAQLDNKARLLVPNGVAAPVLPEYQKTGSVTHRVRPLALEGMEPPAMSRWAVVWNKAYPLRPAGLVATLFGTAEVVNTRRYRNVQGFDAQAMGFPFVAYRVRELTFESRYGIAPPRLAFPDVRLNTRYVDVPGIDGSVRGQIKLGLPIVVSHFNRITPRWTHQERAGSPIVRNLTPEVRPRNWLDAEFGEGVVRLQWRPVKPDGTSMERFGLARIADRRQKVEVPGFNTMRFGDKMTVRRTGLDPVVTQYIDLRIMFIGPDNAQHESEFGHGIAPPIPQMGEPNLLKGYVFPNSFGEHGDMLKMGRPEITANTIRVEPGYWDLLVGEPTVSLKIRALEVSGIGPLVVDATDSDHMGSWGLARLSPHTIYAVSEATNQAKRNHGRPTVPMRPLSEGAVFGRPGVSVYNGLIAHRNAYFGGRGEWMGRPHVMNLLQQVYVEGWGSMRFGMVTIPGDQTIEQDQELVGAKFGIAKVSRPPYVGPLQLKPSGWIAGQTGKPFVSHFHREIFPQGKLMEAMGNSLGNSLGMNMPRGLHVGPPNLHQQTGFDASGHGTPWISHHVRELLADGWDSFLCEYDYQNFKARMTVRRTGQSSAQWQVVGPRGFVATEYSAPDVKPGVHYIRPDGNSDQFRKGVPA